MKEPLLVCPECGTTEVIVYEEQAFMVNTLEHFCMAVKAGDDDAECCCLKCGWTGERRYLRIKEKT